jgi:NAD(P)H-hydrate epimerase
MHKGDRGRLLLVGGSLGMTGAIALAARAAVRAGAGLVTAGVPLSLVDTVEAKLTEAMTLPLPQLEARALSLDAFDAIKLFQPGRLSALAVGPGMGRYSSTQALVRRLVTESELPLVLDADGLHAFDGAADLIRLTNGPPRTVLTPHVGEFLALTGESMESLGEQRFETVTRWAARLNTVLVLKGGPTLIAHPSGDRVAVNPTGSEALATGGSGDVLTGFIAGFLAQGLDAWDAALIGVFLHGLAADYLVDEWNSPYGLAAGDLIEALPYAIGDLLL